MYGDKKRNEVNWRNLGLGGYNINYLGGVLAIGYLGNLIYKAILCKI